jgi:hypothetical protein
MGSQGHGVKLISRPKELKMNRINQDMVVQRYISHPLLIDGKKHDLRLYVLIASIDPFIAFINEEGLARFCVEDYEPPSTCNKKNDKIHLTNYSLNKNSEKFVYTDELTAINKGSKRTLTSYWKSVKEEGFDPNKVQTPTLTLDKTRNRRLGPALAQINEALLALLHEVHLPERQRRPLLPHRGHRRHHGRPRPALDPRDQRQPFSERLQKPQNPPRIGVCFCSRFARQVHVSRSSHPSGSSATL